MTQNNQTGTQRQREKAKKRRELLAAAADIMARKGFHQTRLADVGAAVGISGPGMYRYVESKDALLAEILDEISDRLMAGAREIIDAGGRREASAREVMGELVAFHVTIGVTEPNVVSVQERELKNLDPSSQELVRAKQREYLAMWTEVLERAEPTLGASVARMRVQLVAGMINSVRYVIKRAGPEVVREHAYRMAMSALFS
ncbi:TetR/AcrR family transcriptional regulator [Corynebacterium sanguinis]|uniref:TetR/AcrR family transcriptional regulator n=2 Tax=Corynebacterium sanguinis TaxID=2594913 RepID=A0A6C1U3W3_9CORY|nr:TetR/AcrR family transcriptional regulator [Corynebacterium sanguinis]QDR76947.1 TetR/AcrR family transcriptional regulator [Corynebacterium sanguinis]TVS25888.1 TetR/AcrR family transcriptional regulator [Corynebacterium sanguinis]TVS30291.1 TetR/AcrR family transcriptional regulator [Corynebacterium sanguinis]